MASADESKRPCCNVRRCCLCYCASCCCVALVLGLAVAVIAARFEVPDVEVKSARLTGVTPRPSGTTMSADISLLLTNPNGWPIEGMLHEMSVDIHSLDKAAADEVGEVLYLGQATIPEPVTVETHSETAFDVSSDITVANEPRTAALLARLARDCTGLAAERMTKLRLTIRDTKATAAGIAVDLSEFKIPFETLVPCTPP